MMAPPLHKRRIVDPGSRTYGLALRYVWVAQSSEEFATAPATHGVFVCREPELCACVRATRPSLRVLEWPRFHLLRD